MLAAGTPVSQRASGSASVVSEPIGKRRKLRAYDLAPSKALNPMGVSASASMPVDRLWASVSKGDKYVEFFTEYADEDPKRRGIAISRAAECMLASISEFQKPAYRHIMKEEVWERIAAEIPDAKKNLQILHAGRMAPAEHAQSLRYTPQGREQAHSVSDIENAACWMYDWLKNPSDAQHPT